MNPASHEALRAELLPCPFCGPGQSQIDLCFDDMSKRWRVWCGRCGCSTGTHPRDKTEAPAIAAWNTRPNPPPAKVDIDALCRAKVADALFAADWPIDPATGKGDTFAKHMESRPGGDDAAKRYLKLADTAIALLRSAAGEAWQPMETAPKDGTRVLVDFGRVGVHAVTWEESASGITIWCVDDRKHGPYALRGYIETDVQGWMPLPAALTREQGK